MNETKNIRTGIRDAFVLKVLDKMLALHQRFYTNQRPGWNISRDELFRYPEGSLGRCLAGFLHTQNFHSIPTIERHDVFHLLFGFETHVKDEIAMLCFLVGNGKRTPFTSASAFGASLLYPENYLYFIRHFRRGRRAMNIRNWDFRPFLDESTDELKDALFFKNTVCERLYKKIAAENKKTNYN